MNSGLVTPGGVPTGAGAGSPPTEMKINPTSLEDVTCDSCGNYTFMKVQLMKRMPAVISPTGVEAFMPMDVFSCVACNHVNQRFIQGMGGWFKGKSEDVDATGIPEAKVVVGSNLPGLQEVPVGDTEEE